MIDIRIEGIDGAEAIVADFADAPSRVTKAAVRALNRAMASGRTEMVRDIAKDTGLKSAVVRDALRFREASFDHPSAELGASLKRIPVIHFGATGPQPSRGRGRGVSWRMEGGRKRAEHAFITRVRSETQAVQGLSGHLGVFRRKTTNRLPIKQLYGPSLGHVFAKFRPLGLAKAREAFEKNFAHELEYQAQQGASGAGAD